MGILTLITDSVNNRHIYRKIKLRVIMLHFKKYLLEQSNEIHNGMMFFLENSVFLIVVIQNKHVFQERKKEKLKKAFL